MANLIRGLGANTDITETLHRIDRLLSIEVFGWLGYLIALLLAEFFFFGGGSVSVYNSILFPLSAAVVVAIIMFYPFLLYARNLLLKERNYYRVAGKLMVYKLLSAVIIFFFFGDIFRSDSGPFISIGFYYLLLSLPLLFVIKKEENEKGDSP